MKKNRMMRLASGLLVAALLSTSAVSGTFAKYVTSDSATDTARVAKFGVVLTMQGSSMFSNEYDVGAADVTVKSADDANVVAPGTASGEDSAAFAISGTPEVAVKVDVAFDSFEDVVLKAGTYADLTTADPDDTFTLAEDYYPVVFTLTQTSAAGSNAVAEPLTGSLAEIEAYLSTWSAGAEFAPGTDLASEFELSWAWDFDDNGAGTNDAADTYLGQIAAGVVTEDEANYNLDLNYELTVKVTQID